MYYSNAKIYKEAQELYEILKIKQIDQIILLEYHIPYRTAPHEE